MNINLNFTQYPQESIKQQYAMMLTNDDLPDLTWFAPIGTAEIDEGYVLSFDKYMEEGLMPNLTAFFKEHEDAKAMATYDAKSICSATCAPMTSPAWCGSSRSTPAG